jgi:hypothetical protein
MSDRVSLDRAGAADEKDRSSANQVFILEEDCIEETPEAQVTFTSDDGVISNGANSNGLSADHLESTPIDCETEVVEVKVENDDKSCDDTVDNG